MPSVLLLTAQTMPRDDLETEHLRTSLRERGVAAKITPWTRPGLSSTPADLAVIRSTWDYTFRLEEFLSTLGELGAPLANPHDVVAWNCRKSYLPELGAAGVPVVPTTVVPRGADRERAAAVIAGTVTDLVVKPAVAAGGRGLGRFPARAPGAVDHLLGITAVTDALVQPFVPEIINGERSLMYLGGSYSHAVRKTPASGDYRVHQLFGGQNVEHFPDAVEVAAADAALAAVPGGAGQLLYARVDLVIGPTGPMVMELELIEPELFLPMAPGAADRMADAIVARVAG